MEIALENTNGKQWHFMTRSDGSGMLYYVKPGDPAHYVFFDSGSDELSRLQRAELAMAAQGEWIADPFIDILHRKTNCSRCGKEYELGELNDLKNIPGSHFLYCEKCSAEVTLLYKRICALCGKEYIARKVDESQEFLCPECHSQDMVIELRRVKTNNKRTEGIGLESSLTLKEWLEILDRFDKRCAYCGMPFSDMEHIIPVSSGGGTTKSNCVPACRSCNQRKRHFSVSPVLLYKLDTAGDVGLDTGREIAYNKCS